MYIYLPSAVISLIYFSLFITHEKCFEPNIRLPSGLHNTSIHKYESKWRPDDGRIYKSETRLVNSKKKTERTVLR